MMVAVSRGLTYRDWLFWLQVALLVSMVGGFTLAVFKMNP